MVRWTGYLFCEPCHYISEGFRHDFTSLLYKSRGWGHVRIIIKDVNQLICKSFASHSDNTFHDFFERKFTFSWKITPWIWTVLIRSICNGFNFRHQKLFNVFGFHISTSLQLTFANYKGRFRYLSIRWSVAKAAAHLAARVKCLYKKKTPIPFLI